MTAKKRTRAKRTNVNGQEECVAALYDFARALGITDNELIRAHLPLTRIVEGFNYAVVEIQ